METTIILDDQCSQLSQFLIQKLCDAKHKEKLIWEPIEKLVKLFMAFEVTKEYQENGLVTEEQVLKNTFESEHQMGFVYYMTVSMPDIYKNTRYIVDQILTKGKFPILAYAKALNLWYDKSLAMRILKEHPQEYSHLAEELLSDRDLLKLALADSKCTTLLNTNLEISDDIEIATIAIQHIGGKALEFFSTNITGDADLILLACKSENYNKQFRSDTAMIYAEDSLRNDREFVKKILAINGGYFQFVSDDLKRDREIALLAIKNYGNALLFVSDGLKRDREIALLAIKNYGNAIYFVRESLGRDRDFVMEAVKLNGNAVCLSLFSNDREIVRAAVSQNGLVLNLLNYQLQQDREICLCAVKQNGIAIQFVDERIRDTEIIFEAMKQNIEARKFLNSYTIKFIEERMNNHK